MAEDDCEIEYLDEDEEVVQQCVQNVQQAPQINYEDDDIENQITPLLVERKPSTKPESKRRIKTEEEDSDYDPWEDLALQKKRKKVYVKKQATPAAQVVKSQQKPVEQPWKSVTSQNQPLKRFPDQKSVTNAIITHKKVNQTQFVSRAANQPKIIEAKEVDFSVKRDKKPPVLKDETKARKKFNIRIPDYEDPLCLPVRAIIKEKGDSKRLKRWNTLCLEHFQKSDSSLMLPNGPITSSSRNFVFRNVKNTQTGKMNTLVSGKISVKNDHGEKKFETLQCIIPEFHERKTPSQYKLRPPVKRQFRNKYEVILTKETQKDGDVLITYNPKEAMAAVYKLFGDTNSDDNSSHSEETDEKKTKYIREMTCCKICAPCYQVSWRGVRKNEKKENVRCAVCSRSFVSVYNLLSHLRAHHQPPDVRRRAADISRTLAQVVDYHYRCRICQQQFPSIKKLRKHIVTHQGQEMFKCEVCNHIAS